MKTIRDILHDVKVCHITNYCKILMGPSFWSVWDNLYEYISTQMFDQVGQQVLEEVLDLDQEEK